MASTVTVPPGASVPLNPNAAGGPLQISVMPQASNQAVGSTFQVAITAVDARDLASVPLQLQFDPKLLSLVNVDDGGTAGLLGKDGQAVTALHRDDGNGAVSLSVTRPPGTKGVTGQGTICTLTFKATGAGEATIVMARTGAKDSNQASLPTVGNQAIVHIK